MAHRVVRPRAEPAVLGHRQSGTGAPLWQFQVGGTVRSNPTTFLVDGRQHVSVAAGRAVFVFALPDP